MRLRVTHKVFEKLPSSLKEGLKRTVPIDVAVLGRDAADASSRVRALGYPEVAGHLTEALNAPVEAPNVSE